MADYRMQVGEAIAYARKEAGKSQQALADLLGKDKRTLQKWESGEIRISLDDFFRVFDALKIPAGPYAKWIRHPELFPCGLEDIKRFSTDQKRQALVDYYGHQASPEEIEQKYYILFGNHGSNYYGMLQQRIANLQTPLRDRRRVCGLIIDNYLEARAIGHLTEPTAPQPNMKILTACYNASKESIRNGSNRYSIGSLPDENTDEDTLE